jgi:hypothetical protein
MPPMASEADQRVGVAMPLVLQLAKLSRHLAVAGCAGASLVGVLAVAACADRVPTTPIIPPGDTLPTIDPNDPAFGRSVHFVAPGGTWINTGSQGAPWNLTTALMGAGGRVTPGDTIWILAGTYRGAFTSTVAGTAAAPVVFRTWPGAQAVLEHSGAARTTLSVHGAWTTFWGLEITNLDPVRASASSASEVRPNAVVNAASHTRYINLLVHDAGVGFFSYPNTSDVEVYGSILYNNGWQGPDRGHGHALYVKSDQGPLVLRENIAFNQFGWGIHAYANQGSGGLNGIVIDRNIAFGNRRRRTSCSVARAPPTGVRSPGTSRGSRRAGRRRISGSGSAPSRTGPSTSATTCCSVATR